MSTLKILDVTLRDGGYVNNWGFSQSFANALVEDLNLAGINFIEIGYRNVASGQSNIGLSGMCTDDYVKSIRAAAPNAKVSVMYSPDNVTLEDIETLASLEVAMVRCSIPQGGLNIALPLIKRAYELGMVSTANMTTVTEYPDDQLIKDSNRVVENGCSVLYVADTNGSMTPDKVKSLFELLQSNVQTIPFGFHNHNNLGLGMANAYEAIKMGVEYIDCTLRGMGRAAGNVPTESLATFLQHQQIGPTLDQRTIIQLASYLVQEVPVADLKPTLEDMALGAYDFFTNVQPFITQASAEYGISWYRLIEQMAALNLDKPNITLQQVRSIAYQLSIK